MVGIPPISVDCGWNPDHQWNIYRIVTCCQCFFTFNPQWFSFSHLPHPTTNRRGSEWCQPKLTARAVWKQVGMVRFCILWLSYIHISKTSGMIVDGCWWWFFTTLLPVNFSLPSKLGIHPQTSEAVWTPEPLQQLKSEFVHKLRMPHSITQSR